MIPFGMGFSVGFLVILVYIIILECLLVYFNGFLVGNAIVLWLLDDSFGEVSLGLFSG